MESTKVINGIIVPRLFYEETKDFNSTRSITEDIVLSTIKNIKSRTIKKAQDKEVLELVIQYLNMNLKRL